MIERLLRNIRFYVLVGSIALSGAIYFWVKTSLPGSSLHTIRLTQIYALLAVGYLYIALLATPLTRLFSAIPFRAQYLKARRALGVSAFWFASLHAYLAFFQQLGGFSGLGFLSSKYLIAIGLSATALLILFLMAITSLDVAVEKMGFKNWKRLHRFVYLAGVLILVHATMLGTHFANLSGLIPRILLIALIFLLSLEAIGLYRKWTLVNEKNAPLAAIVVILTGMVIGGLSYYVGLNSGTGSTGLGIHSQHSAQLQTTTPNSFAKYSANLQTDGPILPGQETTLKFTIFEASSGNPTSRFTMFSERFSHLVIVDNQLQYFKHVHPELNGSNFNAKFSFPSTGTYRLYLSYHPLGGSEQEMAFRIDVGSPNLSAATTTPKIDSTEINGNYSVNLSSSRYSSNDFDKDQKPISFTIKDLRGAPVTNLKPYLGAFGHLVMINQQTYEYLHVHPAANIVSSNESGGPTVDFHPSSLTGTIKPGTYRLFLELNPNNELIQLSYTIEVLQ